jgi:hypothetical protein
VTRESSHTVVDGFTGGPDVSWPGLDTGAGEPDGLAHEALQAVACREAGGTDITLPRDAANTRDGAVEPLLALCGKDAGVELLRVSRDLTDAILALETESAVEELGVVAGFSDTFPRSGVDSDIPTIEVDVDVAELVEGVIEELPAPGEREYGQGYEQHRGCQLVFSSLSLGIRHGLLRHTFNGVV